MGDHALKIDRSVQTMSCGVDEGRCLSTEPASINHSPSEASTSLGLHCLTDGEPHERPPHSNFTLVKYAILGSPHQKLTLSEIYLAIASRFPWFLTAGKGWKNSVRHCLSLDTQFQKELRPPTAPGKGYYWTVALDKPRGNKRQRKRSKKPSKHELAVELARLRASPPPSFPLTTPAFREYATTVSPNHHTATIPGIKRLRVHPPGQTGWTPYFPTTARTSAAKHMPMNGHYTEVSFPRDASQPASQALRTSRELSPASRHDDDGSNQESDEDTS